MKKIATLALMFLVTAACIGQQPWKLQLTSPEEKIWYVVGFDIKDDKHAAITIANELGSEDQKLTLTQDSDSTYQLKFVGYNAVKRAQGKKLVKIPSEFKMEIQK